MRGGPRSSKISRGVGSKPTDLVDGRERMTDDHLPCHDERVTPPIYPGLSKAYNARHEDSLYNSWANAFHSSDAIHDDTDLNDELRPTPNLYHISDIPLTTCNDYHEAAHPRSHSQTLHNHMYNNAATPVLLHGPVISSSTLSIVSPLSPGSPLSSSLELWKTYTRGLSIAERLESSSDLSMAGRADSAFDPIRPWTDGVPSDLAESDPRDDPVQRFPRYEGEQSRPLSAQLDPSPSPAQSARPHSSPSQRSARKLRKAMIVEGDWDMLREGVWAPAISLPNVAASPMFPDIAVACKSGPE
ncbi:hypothetical protein BD324DRAFT_647482 [Kockovaella imperatae]|uniref:Uncharacterized protein n=1 Tax=Kockovaella imperatae TaxID=4999 RepID=A0A1Y1USZ6_9TREE|nr:hypothetical protein BD324DRAFT_647482 [Kockovaella imperatae]ORX40556.1 hypothetical protein BD324DRAFT_647482 [Kockovaella imperatae]